MVFNRLPWVLLVVLALVWRALYAFWTPLVNRYLVPPGDDPIYHLDRVDALMHGQMQLFHDGYPLGFHLVAAGLGTAFNLSSLETIRLVPPLLLVIPIPILFWVGSRLFRCVPAGAIGAAAWAFLALAPVRAFGDGTYPNLLGASVLLPLVLLGLYLVHERMTAGRVALVTLPTIALAFTHHLSFVTLIVVALPFSIWAIRQRLAHGDSRGRTMRNLLLGLTCLALAAVVTWPVYGPPLVLPYFEALTRYGSLESALGPFSAPPGLTDFLDIHNPLFFVLGAVGLLAVWFDRHDPARRVLLLGWIGVLVLLSISPVFGLPGRFLRELAVPLALVIGYLPVALWQRLPRGAGQLLVVGLFAGLFAVDVLNSFHRPYALPDPYGPLVRVQHDEEEALLTLEIVTPEDGTILANNSNPYLGYLVDRRVIVVSNPLDVDQLVMIQPISTVFVGARPPLTPADVYPYFRNFDETAAAMRQLPDTVLIHELPSGTTIYKKL